jgi:hypothetical protein
MCVAPSLSNFVPGGYCSPLRAAFAAAGHFSEASRPFFLAAAGCGAALSPAGASGADAPGVCGAGGCASCPDFFSFSSSASSASSSAARAGFDARGVVLMSSGT